MNTFATFNSVLAQEGNIDRQAWSKFHWLIALAFGSYFAVSNYLQNAVASGGYSSVLFSLVAFVAFFAVYNLFAVILRFAWRLPVISIASDNTRFHVWAIHALFFFAACTIQLSLIAVLTTAARSPDYLTADIITYAKEIFISCTPVWMITYFTAFFALHALPKKQHQPAKPADAQSGLEHRENGVLKHIRSDTILTAEAKGNYVEIVTETSTETVRVTIAKLEALLPETEFIRTHRGFIVRKSLIKAVRRTNSGAYIALLENDAAAAPVSRRRLAAVRLALSD
ncbi:LytTR family DNA-binding domain-containing protein [Hyphococcus flavus]|uniref:LytTR family DNA-binding domain-containing protein n=1 Tax=Hyphococcus flavus TaxID=1866326 RepID=A0AAF0CF97_9PROT|nr:LytTR family DNA-binding domain-containing protein [Hyphococcus flavus]WDI32291.1 LytTR family DNA-binding domain-containing protein [Hyphococcus flavus]